MLTMIKEIATLKFEKKIACATLKVAEQTDSDIKNFLPFHSPNVGE